jgi:transcriptional regulator with XRE-family HTH domain
MQALYSPTHLRPASGSNMRIRMTDVARRIRELRKGLRLNQADFAERLGVTQSTVSKWESNKQTPDTDAVFKLSEISGAPPADFLFDHEDHDYRTSDWGITSRVIGAVQAGEWVEAVQWPPYEQFDVKLPTPRNWPDYEIDGFVVRGSSMNLLYPEGSIVFAVPTIKYGLNPGPGDKVIVQRLDDRGLYEVTLKELVLDRAGKLWLWPRSNDPEHQSPISLHGPRDNSIVEVVVTGIVAASFVLENPGRFAR